MVKNIKIFECENKFKENLLYKKAVKDRLPFFKINMGSKYVCIEYDMITVSFTLDKDSVSRLNKLFNELLYLYEDLDSDYIAGEGYGLSPLIPLDEYNEHALKVAEIVFNKQNLYIDPHLPKEILEYELQELS